MSRIVVCLLVLIFPLQVLSAGQRHLMHTRNQVVKHMLEHVRHVPHHHDADGTVHHDGGNESVSHLLDFDYGTSLSAIPSTLSEPAALRQSQVPPGFFAFAIPSPFVRPPHPPPRKAPLTGGAQSI